MSTPRNILDAYRSYTYHHVFAVCDSTAAAEALAEQTDITFFDISKDSEYRNHPQAIPGREDEGYYIVLINQAADPTFYISSAQWTTMMTPTVEDEGMDYHTSMVQGEMTVVEPKGVRFLNTINTASEALNADPHGMVFVLKTVFTGYRSDGGRDLITTVDPLLLSIYDISADFSITGATYAISFAAIFDGMGMQPEVSAITDGMSLQLDSVATVQKAMSLLQEKLNTKYKKFKEKIKKQSDCSGNTIDWDNEFIDVEYRIEVDDDYKDMQVGDNHKFLQKEFGENDSIVVQEDDSLNIESIIKSIMQSSREVIINDNPERELDFFDQDTSRKGYGNWFYNAEEDETYTVRERENRREDLREKAAEKQKYTFKIHSTVNSTKDKYVVTYHVVRYEIPTNVRTKQGQTRFVQPRRGQGIEFDYIFTGENVDILDFEIKMSMGISFFQMLLSSESIPNATQTVGYEINQSMVAGTGEINPATSNPTDNPNNETSEKAKKPLFLGMSVRDKSLRNKQSSSQMISYNALLSRFAGLESVNQTVTIRGNPQLLAESSPLPSRLIFNKSVPVIMTEEVNRQIPEDEGIDTIIPKMWEQPGFARINIQMPSLEDDNPDYSEKFWYRGWFYIREINNSFEDGQFKQTLQLNAFPTDALNQMTFGTQECDEDDTSTSSDSDADQDESQLASGARSTPRPATGQELADMSGEPLEREELERLAPSAARTYLLQQYEADNHKDDEESGQSTPR